ncbi:MAG: hypothetical protein WDN02_06035 [Methylovirgula sp.]|uniref:hypothetical protein n=1 Tax=Methylovirgula sp. TaxID=1978224 RepID=UPI0030760AB8
MEMTEAATEALPAATRSKPLPVSILILAALALGLVMSSADLHSVWQHGTFADSDDAMQLVEVRNFLAGQNWFDLTVARLDPPHGIFMHWSRFIDAPLALLIKTFELFMPVDAAERLTRICFPLLLQGLLYVGIARLARQLAGKAAILPAIVLTLLSGMNYTQFQLGRINHSASQIVLLVFMLGSFIDALDPAHARRAAFVGILAAISLAISLENLPWIFVFAALAIIFFVVRGAEMRTHLIAFGVGLGVALPLTYVATIGPARWLDESCDAYSLVYFVPGLAGAAMLILLGTVSLWLKSVPARIGVAFAATLCVGGAVAFGKPICFLDPYAGIDPLLRDVWLKNVEEALPLSRYFIMRPSAAIIMLMPVLFGFAAVVAACRMERGLARLRWLTIASLAAAGLLMCFWQIRIFSFVGPVALLGGAWAIARWRDRLSRGRWHEASALALILVLPFSSIGWALAAMGFPSPAQKQEHARAACLASSAFVPLAQLPPGLIAGPIDAGSHILALTPHSVLAAPYHRDNHGNRVALDAFLAAPAQAQSILRADNVRYVVNCSGFGEMKALAKRAPNSLAMHIVANTPPAWLAPFPSSGAYQVFVIRP